MLKNQKLKFHFPPDIDWSTTDCPSRGMVFGCRVERMEHVPIGEHELTKEDTVVSHRCNVNGMRDRVPWVEII